MIINKNYNELIDNFENYGEYQDKFIALDRDKHDNKAWGKAKQLNSKNSYHIYLKNYYNGIYANEAKIKVDEFIRLEKEKELEEQRLRDIERAKERDRLEKIEKERKLALEKEKKAWKLVLKKNTKEDYENYLKFYPDGIYCYEAESKVFNINLVEEDSLWDKVLEQDNEVSYTEYLNKYPNGMYLEEAKKYLLEVSLEITRDCDYPRRFFIFYNELMQQGVRTRETDRYLTVTIQPIYNNITILRNGLLLVTKDYPYDTGLISRYGTTIYEFGKYNLIEESIEDKEKIEVTEENEGYLTFSTIEYDKQCISNKVFISMFDNSVTKLIDKRNNTFGYIGGDEDLLLEPLYEYIKLLKNGIGIIVHKNGKFGLINNKYELILQPKYESIYWKSNNENIAIVHDEKKKYGLVNNKGEIVLNLAFDYITNENGFFIVRKGSHSQNPKFGLIHKNGKRISHAIYDQITYLKNENIFLLYKDKKFGFTNNQGKITIYPEVELERSHTDFIKYYFRGHVFDEKENLLLVKKNGKLGLVNKNGEYVLYPRYDTIDGYENKYLKVMFVREEHESGFVDKRGKYILDLDTYELTRPCDYSIISTIKLRNINPLIGLINWHTGKIILPIKYKSLSCEHIDNNIYKFTSGLKSGLIDVNGKIILDLVNILKFNSLKKKFLK